MTATEALELRPVIRVMNEVAAKLGPESRVGLELEDWSNRIQVVMEQALEADRA